jgi:HEAT repeat protein
MIMRAIAVAAIAGALGAGAIGAAVKMTPAPVALSVDHDWEKSRPGPDSGRVAILIDALSRTDPVVCELIGDQLGNFWWGNSSGVGRLAAAPASVVVAKDSISGTITDSRAINRLIAELDGSSACTRRVASKMLGNSSIPGARLSSLLSNASANVREAAALAAGNGDHKDVIPALQRALNDQSPAVVAMAAYALGELEDRASVNALINLLRSSDEHVRVSAIWALGQIEDARAVPGIVGALTDPNAAIRRMAADVLGEFDDDSRKAQAVAPLERALANDADARVRAEAAESLGQISAPSSAAVLGRALSDSDIDVRRAAAEALSDLDDVRVAPPGLVAALSATDPELRYRAAKAVTSIADPATTTALISILSSPDAELRKDAVEALGKIGSEPAVQAITRALTDRDPEVRKAAAETLGDLKDS